MTRVEIKTVAQLDRGLAYGECCFETMRVVDGAIFEWPCHWQRLNSGLAEFGMALANADKKPLFNAILQAAAEKGNDALVRLTVSGGEAPWGLLPSSDRNPVAFLQAMPAAPVRISARLQCVSWPFPLYPKKAKFSSDYADSLRAVHSWQGEMKSGCEPLLTSAGAEPRLLSGITANLLLFREGRWFTPQGDGILPGVVRNWLIDRGEVQEALCPLSWLQEVEVMALCNSGHFICPVAEVDGHRLDPVHPELKRLCSLLAGQAGVPVLGEED